MGKKSVWIIGVIVIIVLVAAAMVVLNNQKTAAPTKTSTSSGTKTSYTPAKACDVLPLDIAQKVDPGVAASDAPADVTNESIMVSNCNYYDAANRTSIGVLVRGAKDGAGAGTNKSQFDNPPSGVQRVSGYGDKAYWDPSFGQLNILKSHNWYILSYGPVSPTDRTLEMSKKLADAIIQRL